MGEQRGTGNRRAVLCQVASSEPVDGRLQANQDILLDQFASTQGLAITPWWPLLPMSRCIVGWVFAPSLQIPSTAAALCSTEAQTGSSSSFGHFSCQGHSSRHSSLKHLPAHQSASYERGKNGVTETENSCSVVNCERASQTASTGPHHLH